jgi:hypothetical protein
MSRMLLGMNLHVLILSITPIFFAAFLGLLFWVFQRGRASHYQTVSQLPLDARGEQ